MIDFLRGLAGATVGMLVMSLILMLVLAIVPGTGDVVPTRSDRVGAIFLGAIAAVVVSGLVRSVAPDPSKFVDSLGLGAGVAVIFGAEILLARARGHVEPARIESSALVTEHDRARRPGQYVPPARFSSAVHRRFADPEARARYVVAAYRQGLLPVQSVPGLAADIVAELPTAGPAWAELAIAEHESAAGLEAIVDRAAGELGYAPTDQQERDDLTERLVYSALCSSDPRVRRDTVELLAPPAGPLRQDVPEWQRDERIRVLRAVLTDAFDVRYEAGCQRRGTSPLRGSDGARPLPDHGLPIGTAGAERSAG